MITKSDRTRQFIIEKAAPLINRKGMAGTSMSDIMDATKLAKGGLYGNFESKDEICSEAFDYLMQRISLSIDAKLSAENSFKDKLFALLDYYVDISEKDAGYGCPMLNFGTEADDTHPIIKQKVNKAIQAAQNRIYKIVKSGIEAREFTKHFDPIPFAIKAFALIEGGILISKMQGSNRQMHIIVDILKKEIVSNGR